MKALTQEILYEKNTILFSFLTIIFLYIIYAFMFSEAEFIISILSCGSISSLYGSIVNKRKIINFERFLATTPLGRKSIINTGYLISIIFNIIIVLLFCILRIIKNNLFYEYTKNLFLQSDIYISNILFFAIFGIGLIANSIMFPIFILSDKENKSLPNILFFVIIFFSVFLIYIILTSNIFTFNIKVLLNLAISCIIYIISYFITLKLYLKKDL